MPAKISGPLVKAPGGKFLDGPWIISHFPEHATFVDVMGFSASVTVLKERSTFEHYNDINIEVVNFFEQLLGNLLALVRMVKWTPYSREVYERCLLRQKTHGIEGAYNFYVCNQMGRTGGKGYRTRGNIGRKEGRYNPAMRWKDLSRFFEFAERLRGVHLERKHYLSICSDLDHPDTLFYMDPPYYELTRKSKGQLYRYEIRTCLQHARLLWFARKLKGKVIISGYPSRLYYGMLERHGWKMYTKVTRDDGRNERIEAIWINPAGQAAKRWEYAEAV